MLYLLQRFGFSLPTSDKQTLWLHAASVGEVNACYSLIKSLQEQNIDLDIMVSTNTSTGRDRLLRLHDQHIRHFYLPFDIPVCVSKIFGKIKPRCLLVVETEVWPNLYSSCETHGTRLAVINGRVSEKTLHTYGWLGSIYKKALSCPQLFLSRSATDTSRYIALGVDSNLVHTLGNLKYTVKPVSGVEPVAIEQPFILAASTRDNEEAIIVKAWQQATTQNLLVIAPRHPKRKSEILKALSGFNLTIAIRSENGSVNDETDIYLVDTLGELGNFIAQSEFVIIGGSFVNKGGQNLIEAAHAGKAVVFGASMYNFQHEAHDFLQHEAAIQVQSEDELTQIITDLSQNLVKRNSLAKNGSELAASYQHVLDDYLDILLPFIKQE